jgi:hypothetical protein
MIDQATIDSLIERIERLEIKVDGLENPSVSQKIGALPTLTPSDDLRKTKEILNYLVNFHNLKVVRR